MMYDYPYPPDIKGMTLSDKITELWKYQYKLADLLNMRQREQDEIDGNKEA